MAWKRKGEIMAKVTIYSLPTCTHCKAAKKFFEDQNIPFEDVDLTQNDEAMDEMIAKGYKGTPIIRIDGEDVVGFNAKKIQELLAK